MAGTTISEQLDTLYTTTWQIRKKDDVDQVFSASPFWYMMTKKGSIDYQEGGRWIEQPLNYAKNDTVSFIGKGGVVSLAAQETKTVSVTDWKMGVVNVTRYYVDELKNRGKAQAINRVTKDLDNARSSLISKFEEVLFADATEFGGLEFDGLKKLIAIDPTTGTVCNIDRAANTWWRNNTKNMSGEAASTYLIKRMRNMHNTCGIYGDGMFRFPNIVVTDQTSCELYEEEALQLFEITDKKIVDLGMGSFQFKGSPMTWSPNCTSGYMYFLNANDLKFICDPAAFFEMTKWKEVANQVNDRFAQILIYGNLMLVNSRRQGIIYNIAE